MDAIEQIKELNQKAFPLYQQGKQQQAISLLKQACNLAHQFLPDHILHVATLNNLALLYREQGNYLEAESLHQQTLVIFAKALVPNYSAIAKTLNNLAQLYTIQGKYPDAKNLYQQALAIRKEVFGSEHHAVANTLNNLGDLYQILGDYPQAESYYQEALAIRESVFGSKHYHVAITLNSLGELYRTFRNYSKAIPFYQRALSITKRVFGLEHSFVADMLNNLGLVYYAQGNYSKAIPLYQLALDIAEKVLVPEHPDVATILNNLGLVYCALRKYFEAMPLYRRALDIRKKAFGSAHPHVAISFNNLGLLYCEQGNYSDAMPLYERALAIRKKAFGSEHSSVATSLLNLAGLQAATNRPRKALHLMQDAAKIQNQVLGQIFSISSDAQRLIYLQQIRSELDIFLSLVTQYLPDAPEVVQAAFDLVLRRKALGAEAAAIQRSTILLGRYPDLAPQLEQLRQLDNQIASLTWNVPLLEQLAAYQTQLATLYQQREELDRTLSRQIPEMNLQKQLDTANRDAIAKALPDGATLVEFVRFNVFNFKAIRANGDSQWLPARYLAFILPAKEPEQVQMIDLGEAEAIDNLIRVFRKSVSGDRDLDLDDLDSIPQEPESIPPDVQLRQKLIDPLKPYFTPNQRIFLAPDGELCCLPFGVLPTDEGRYLIEDYELCYLSVGRDLLRFGATQTLVQPTQPLVIADPDYNLTIDIFNNVDCRGSAPVPTPSPLGATTGGLPLQELMRGNGEVFKPIPATQIEGMQVAARLSVTPQMGTQALKSLVSRCQSPWILHIATHGYFLETRPEIPPPQMMNFQRLHSAAQQNPLARSGLAFAGANTVLDGGNLPPEAEDGLLTAQGASGLNLAATALVVASACETALGDVQVGEGVLGLRRAFVLAGAQTLIMSLWSVPDVATAILMERLYHNLLTETMGRAKALEQAQFYVRDLTIAQMRPQWLIPETITRLTEHSPAIGNHLQELCQKPENHRPYAHRKYWGAWVCQGDTTPMQICG